MSIEFEISKLAIKDLDGIWEYTAEFWSKEQANKYYKEIFKAIYKICNNPEMGISMDDIKTGHRKVYVKSHIIFYKWNRQKIYIDRILHQKMDIEHQLNE